MTRCSDRFGPNGAVMDEMSDEMREEYEHADYSLDFRLADSVPTVIGAVAMPFAIRSEVAVDLGPSLGVLILALAGLYGAVDVLRIRNEHPASWREHQRWSMADWRARVMQVVLAASVPLGMAAVLSAVFGR